MTLGERLYELRTQKGLSQLELAEALGVSRQSVSKWETDAAVPEIDKLISISRYFDISVGSLLGVEEPAEETGDTAAANDAADDELTDRQLKLVEAIVERYVAALPQPMSKKRKLVLKIALAVAAVCLAVGLYKISGQLTELHVRYNDLANSLSIINSNVSSQIDGITNRVEAALEQQTRITADASVEIISADVPGRMVTFAVRAKPKTYVEDMTAYFEFENGTARESFGPIEPVGTAFAMDCTVALTDEINIYVAFEHDGQRETQLLDSFYDLYTDTLPSVWVMDVPAFTYTLSGNNVTWVKGDWYVQVTPGFPAWHLDQSTLPQPEIASVEVGLFRDQRLLWWAEKLDSAPDGLSTQNMDTMYFRYSDAIGAFAPDGAFTQGGVLQSVARVTDTFGRVFLFAGETSFVLAENGTLDGQQGAGARWWIEDPSEWDFTPWK